MMARAVGTAPRPRLGNLPAEATSFVGRRDELAEASSMLARSRLLTLTGVGGVGKTRLALRVAASVSRAFPDGVWLVDLTKLSESRMLAQAVVEAVEIREHSARDPVAVLTDHVRDRQMLLILDNCEHMLQECAELADALLRSSPGLRVLATSRQALNIAAETIMVLAPLSLDDQEPSGGSEPERAEGVALFVDRATTAKPGFALTPRNLAAVAGICRRLDGLPLAIELAAARVRDLAPEQILSGLQHRFRLLSEETGDGDPRHRSLRALIDWSYALCWESERVLWARSSVFAGTFTLDAVESVCTGDGIPPGDIVDAVAGLVDKSIFVRELHGGVSRYRQIETIREYGRNRLAELGTEHAIRLRHREHYQRLAARTAQESFGPNQVSWFGHLRLDHADLRQALEHFATNDPAAPGGLQMAADLLFHWISSYFLNEGRRWLDRLLALDRAPTAARLDALWVDAWLALIQNDVAAAKSMLTEARELGEQLDDAEYALASVALFTGMAAMFDNDTSAALALYQEALRRGRSTRNGPAHAGALIRMSMAYSHLGDADRAIALGEECRAVCDEAGEIWHKSYATAALGIQVWQQGDTDRAARLEKESLEMNQALGDMIGIALNIEVLALIARTERKYERAARLLGALRPLHRVLGMSLEQYTHLSGQRDESVREAKDALGERTFSALEQEGAAASFSESVEYALHGEEGSRATGPGSAGPQPLTPREREIAELVAQGKSNREIATALVIAPRTAESHVEHILIKLGFVSRAQIAAWVAEHKQS